MKTFDITIPVTEASFEELSPEQQTLVTLARKATFRSYAPYSKFKGEMGESSSLPSVPRAAIGMVLNFSSG